MAHKAKTGLKNKNIKRQLDVQVAERDRKRRNAQRIRLGDQEQMKQLQFVHQAKSEVIHANQLIAELKHLMMETEEQIDWVRKTQFKRSTTRINAYSRRKLNNAMLKNIKHPDLNSLQGNFAMELKAQEEANKKKKKSSNLSTAGNRSNLGSYHYHPPRNVIDPAELKEIHEFNDNENEWL